MNENVGMRRRRSGFAAVVMLLIGACSSSDQVKVIPPEIFIQPLAIPEGRPLSMTSFSNMVRIDIQNLSSETLVMEKLDIASVGVGAFTILPSTHRFNFTIPTGRRARFEVWVDIIAEDRIGGPEGYIMVRGVAFFRTAPAQRFRRAFTQKMAVRTRRGTGF